MSISDGIIKRNENMVKMSVVIYTVITLIWVMGMAGKLNSFAYSLTD